MAPKGKEKRKENKRQRWKSLDAETKQPTQESEPADCGGDASKATEGKTGASAHFRFKEQQDWQDEPAELNEFFSIDCDKIVDALLTIPVHERLGLPEDIFPAHVIQEFKDEAAACTERYEAFLRTGKRQDKKMPDVGESLTNTLQAAIIAAAKSKPKPKDEDDLEELLNLSLKSPQSDEPSRKDKKKDDDERSLEFLLSLTEERAEKDLVPAAEEPATTTVAEPEPKAMEEPVKPPPQPQKPTVDLEDWLDSVLQD
ncbi:hypothetical protein HPB51_022708 [Rhipicephalus microplus]|uniref:Cell death regulator aven n=1 Tax=Rhipicephalus microplus TaxID=6941 RepID=A0A9J6E475_RHIMP|nr:hypothetical protein HPB51_022708 [Rhipicephalus microplus]